MTFRWWVEEELTIDGTQYVVLQLRYIPPHIKLFHCTDTSGQHTTFLLQMVVLQPKIFSGCICICTYCNWSFQCCKVSKWRVRCEMMIWYSVVVYLVPGLGKCWIRPKTGSAVREGERLCLWVTLAVPAAGRVRQCCMAMMANTLPTARPDLHPGPRCCRAVTGRAGSPSLRQAPAWSPLGYFWESSTILDSAPPVCTDFLELKIVFSSF